MSYSELLAVNQEAFAMRCLNTAAKALSLALSVAIELQDEQKLSEIRGRAGQQMREVWGNFCPDLSRRELNDYTAIIELAESHLVPLQNPLSHQ